MQEELFEEVLRGNIHMIGSDHAPHTAIRKQGDKPASGTPCILAIPLLIDALQKAGIKEGRLDNLLFYHANRIYFGGKLKPRQVETTYEPQRWIERYGHNSFDRVDGSSTHTLL
jgi:dihydroorotase-like cyclic amidohydrolase